MKSKICIFLLFLSSLGVNKAYAQSICFCYKGAWSDWKKVDYSPTNYRGCSVKRYTDLSGFLLETKPGQTTFFSFRINNFILPSKQEIKRHWKNNEWYVYTGIVEYYVNDEFPTAEALAKSNRLVCPNPRLDQTPNVKRTASATIKIAPFKKEPAVYNLWFDNIGIGFSALGFTFK